MKLMVEPVEFPSAVTLNKHEALDLVAACDEVLDLAEAGGHVEVALTVEGTCRLVLGRLLGELDVVPIRSLQNCTCWLPGTGLSTNLAITSSVSARWPRPPRPDLENACPVHTWNP